MNSIARDRPRLAVVCAAVVVMAAGCLQPPAGTPSGVWTELVRERERAEGLEREIERLNADLEAAEDTLIGIESGLKGQHTRADAVSALADARILVRRAQQAAPWRRKEARTARKKLHEADRSIQAGHFGSALFFTSRARRIAETLLHESETASDRTGVLFVSGSRVNVRAGPSTGYEVLDSLVRRTPVLVESNQGLWVQVRTPSGTVGWIHNSLLGDS